MLLPFSRHDALFSPCRRHYAIDAMLLMLITLRRLFACRQLRLLRHCCFEATLLLFAMLATPFSLHFGAIVAAYALYMLLFLSFAAADAT